jgi:hypothetical protein
LGLLRGHRCARSPPRLRSEAYPAIVYFRRPFSNTCRHAPARKCGGAPEGSNGDDVGLHRRGAVGDAADRAAGRRTADTWGRKPLFLAGFAILPIRAALYTFSDASAGIFGALTPLVITDIMRGTGRYNLAQGAIATVQGIGASLSGLAAGVIVDRFGYSAAFLSAGGAALVALIVFALRMPETAQRVTPAAQGIATRPVTLARSQMRGRSRS